MQPTGGDGKVAIFDPGCSCPIDAADNNVTDSHQQHDGSHDSFFTIARIRDADFHE
jgi:hypothetical protein